MKDSPESGTKCKQQKLVRFQIEDENGIETCVTLWQELENCIRVEQTARAEINRITTQYHSKFI